MAQLSAVVLNAVLEGLEVQKQQVDSQIAEVRSLLGGTQAAPVAASDEKVTPRRKLSAATRRKMALAQQRRWAAKRPEPAPAQAPAKKQPTKRRLSAKGLANIRAAVKRRWAAAKKAKG